LTVSMTIVALLFLCIGISSSLAFTDIASGSITAYLTETFPNNPWYPIVNILVMMAVFLTFPLQLTPAMQVLDEWFGPGCDPKCFQGRSLWHCRSLLLVQRQRQRRQQETTTRRRMTQGETASTMPSEVDESQEGEDEDHFDDESVNQDIASNENDGILMSHAPLHTLGTIDHNDKVTAPPLPTDCVDCADGLATTMITSNDQGHEIHVPAPLPPPNTWFGKYEWVFRRYMVVIGCALVVLVVNNLALLMSLFGAVGQTGLALMPCAIHLQLQRHEIVEARKLLCVVDGFTIAFSILVMITGIVFSVQEIIQAKQLQS
jgi:Transmembrane amino acid transporter protein